MFQWLDDPFKVFLVEPGGRQHFPDAAGDDAPGRRLEAELGLDDDSVERHVGCPFCETGRGPGAPSRAWSLLVGEVPLVTGLALPGAAGLAVLLAGELDQLHA